MDKNTSPNVEYYAIVAKGRRIVEVIARRIDGTWTHEETGVTYRTQREATASLAAKNIAGGFARIIG